MELVDQKRIALDDPIDRFVPAFRGIAVKKPLTIRHLFTHTSGLPGDWSRGMSAMDRRVPGNVAVADYRGNIGESMMDMDQRIAGYYPLLKVADHYEYQETDLALARSIVELASGEPLTDLYQKHLLGPLGCDRLTISDMAGTAHGTAMDLARLSQMLLNRGAYGEKRFFSALVSEQMLPQPIGRILGNDEKYEQGIGTQTHGGPGLSSHSFGHRSASETTVRIDPDNDLVIVMVRNAQGKNFDKYHPRFIAAVTEAMDH
jgi:CubicO group peptidase (beta-lactamase class C family)